MTKFYEYEMTARGVNLGAQPGGFIDFDESQGKFGIVRYDRELTAKELADYEMREWKTEVNKDMPEQIKNAKEIYDDLKIYSQEHFNDFIMYDGVNGDRLHDSAVAVYNHYAADILGKNDFEKFLNKDNDQEIARMLLNYKDEMNHNGFTKETIVSALKEASPVAIESGQNLSVYINEVIEAVFLAEEKINEGSLGKRIGDVRMEPLVQEYQARATAMQEKYGDRPFTAFQDGKIAVELVIEGCDAAELKKVISEHSLAQGVIHPTYEDKVVNDAVEVCKAYDVVRDGKNIPLSKDMTPANAYKKFASEVLEKKSNHMLNGRDEQRIAARMMGYGISAEDVKKTMVELSPVGKESGRSAERYANTTVEVANKEYEKKVAFSKELYPTVLAEYDAQIDRMEKDYKARGEELINRLVKSRTYCDGRAARGMLEKKCNEYNVANAIAERSPQAKVVNENSPMKTPESYAAMIVDKVKKEIAAEKAILGYKSESENTPANKYRAIVKERVDMYPSDAKSLNEPFIDLKTATKMMDMGISNAEIAQAIKEASPRAKMPGIPDNYAEQVVERAFDNIVDKVMIKREFEDVRDKYVKECGLMTEGVDGGEKALDNRSDARIAMKLLNQGEDQTYIRNTIAEVSPYLEKNKDIDIKPYSYAQKIIYIAEEMIHRTNAIDEFIVPKEPAEMTVANEYVKRMQDELAIHKELSASMEIGVITEMVKENYDKDAIEEAIREFSPVAVEPGRGEGYPKWTITNAEANIERQNRFVEKYVPIAREEKAELAVDEYKYHVDRFKWATQGGKMNAEIDGRIVKAMFEQKFNKKDITAALIAKSPCASNIITEARTYAQGIVKNAEKAIKLEAKEKSKGAER